MTLSRKKPADAPGPGPDNHVPGSARHPPGHLILIQILCTLNLRTGWLGRAGRLRALARLLLWLGQ